MTIKDERRRKMPPTVYMELTGTNFSEKVMHYQLKAPFLQAKLLCKDWAETLN